MQNLGKLMFDGMTDGAEWKRNGKVHRDNDFPARMFDNGRLEWWVDGKLHRDPGADGEDQPAVITETGVKWYYANGVIHRDGDKPAIEHPNGRLEWCVLGITHRDGDKPALITETGDMLYYKNGVIHREEDKPAKIFANGRLEWWVEGKAHRDGDMPACITESGEMYYYKNGLIHRDGDKPAQILSTGQIWYKNGVYHRDTLDESGDPLPAYVGPKWSSWFINGELKNRKYPWVSMLPDGTKGYYHAHPSHILFDNGIKFMLDDKYIVMSEMKAYMDERTDIELLKCSICMENKKNTLFNCGHLCSCRACSERLETCPVCRAGISTRTNVYL
jgi:hypothetical protein